MEREDLNFSYISIKWVFGTLHNSANLIAVSKYQVPSLTRALDVSVRGEEGRKEGERGGWWWHRRPLPSLLLRAATDRGGWLAGGASRQPHCTSTQGYRYIRTLDSTTS